MSTIIFNEVDRNQTARYKVKGCEKVIVVRASGVFNMTIETVSQLDPHFRPRLVMTVSQSSDICIEQWPCFACGVDVIFRVDDNIDPQAHLFVEILDDTCVPEPCCDCN